MRTYLAAAGLAAALLAGCDAGKPKLAPVRGTVTYNGKPLADGGISFHTGHGNPAVGVIKNGQIQDVMTFTAGDGAPVGPARVSVVAYGPPDPATTGGSKEPDPLAIGPLVIPEKYTNPEKSGLTAEIKPGENNMTFDLK